MATSPARKPLVVNPASHFLLDMYAQNMAVNPAAQAASVVLVAPRGGALAGCESVPAEPQDQAAAHGDRQVMRQHGRSAISFEGAPETRTKHDCSGESDQSADGMDDSGSGEIVEAHSQRRPNVAIATH